MVRTASGVAARLVTATATPHSRGGSLCYAVGSMEYWYLYDFILLPAAAFLIVAACFGLWLRRSWRGSVAPRWSASRALGIGMLLLTAAAAATATWFATARFKTHHGFVSVGPALVELRRAPLIRLLLTDVPGVDTMIRLALEQDIREPVREGPTRTFAMIADLRKTYIVPGLKSADDKTALDAIAARSKALRYLQAKSLALCREFALSGLQRVDQLDAEGQKLFYDMLYQLEGAYISGRDSGLVQREALDGPGVRQALSDAGFLPGDIAKLKRLDEIADVEVCAIVNRLNEAPAHLPAPRAAALARHLLVTQ